MEIKMNMIIYIFIPKEKKIIKYLQYIYENKTGKDLLFCKKPDKEISKYVVTKTERTKNPYRFKIENHELISIHDYIEEIDATPEYLEKPELKQKDQTSKVSNSNKITKTENYSNEELIKKLNEEKNKNNQLLKELDNEKKKVLELEKKIKLLEEKINSKSKDSKRINELEKEINLKNKEINNLKKMIENNNLVTSINPGEEVIAVNFTSIDQTINYPIACKNTTILARLEEKNIQSLKTIIHI